MKYLLVYSLVFYVIDAAFYEFYTLSLHDALPICPQAGRSGCRRGVHLAQLERRVRGGRPDMCAVPRSGGRGGEGRRRQPQRSEERRVGKECSARGGPYRVKKLAWSALTVRTRRID